MQRDKNYIKLRKIMKKLKIFSLKFDILTYLNKKFITSLSSLQREKTLSNKKLNQIIQHNLTRDQRFRSV